MMPATYHSNKDWKHVPKWGLVPLMEKVIERNWDSKETSAHCMEIIDMVKAIFNKLEKRGTELVKDKAGKEVECYKIKYSELDWLKQQYETII